MKLQANQYEHWLFILHDIFSIILTSLLRLELQLALYNVLTRTRGTNELRYFLPRSDYSTEPIGRNQIAQN